MSTIEEFEALVTEMQAFADQLPVVVPLDVAYAEYIAGAKREGHSALGPAEFVRNAIYAQRVPVRLPDGSFGVLAIDPLKGHPILTGRRQ